MPDAAVILINGYPGVGKYSVALELAKILPNARVLDMHQLDIAANALHEGDDAHTDALRYKLRETVLESLAATPSSTDCPTVQTPPIYLLTDTLYTSSPTRSYKSLYLSEAKDHHLPILHLIISCSIEENIHRLTDTTRNALKDHDESHVVETRMTHEIAHFVTPGRVGKGGAKGLEGIEGLAGEYEVDTTVLGLYGTAGVLGEYVMDRLRLEGWYFQLKRTKVVRPGR